MISLRKLLSVLLPARAGGTGMQRRQEQELRGMGARELADLGIGASEIPFLFQKGKENCIDGADAATASTGIQRCQLEQRSFKQMLVLQQ